MGSLFATGALFVLNNKASDFPRSAAVYDLVLDSAPFSLPSLDPHKDAYNFAGALHSFLSLFLDIDNLLGLRVTALVDIDRLSVGAVEFRWIQVACWALGFGWLSSVVAISIVRVDVLEEHYVVKGILRVVEKQATRMDTRELSRAWMIMTAQGVF